MKTKGRDLTVEEINHEMAVYGRVRTAVEVQQAEQKQEARRIGMALNTNPDTKALLDMLVNLYYKGDMTGDTPEKTYFNLGRREVVEYLLDMRDRALKEK